MSSNIPKRMVIGGNKKIKGGLGGILVGGEIPDIQKSLILFFLYFYILLLVGVGFDRIRKSTTGVTQQTYVYAFLASIIPVFFLIAAGGIQYINTVTNPFNSFIGKLIIIGLIIAGIILLLNYVSIVIVILIIIVGLAIVFHQFYDTFERTIQTSRFKFVIEFIFFIPCLFNDILRWGLNQIQMTHYFTYVILLIEILLILIYFFLPVILNRTILGSGSNVKILQGEPFYINKGKERKIANANDLQQKPVNSKDLLNNLDEPVFNKDYAFSMWINMNPQTISSDKEIQIFTYGLLDKSLKPKIVYKTNSTPGNPSIQNVYRIYFTGDQTGSKNNYYEIYLPNQKWNHFVLNYIEGRKVEVWINGKMERVFIFGENENNTSNIPLPEYQSTDLVAIGSSKASGTNGAICSVLYFYKSITASKVVSLYNLGVTTKPYPGNYSN